MAGDGRVRKENSSSKTQKRCRRDARHHDKIHACSIRSEAPMQKAASDGGFLRGKQATAY
jgi:hypothetical protein